MGIRFNSSAQGVACWGRFSGFASTFGCLLGRWGILAWALTGSSSLQAQEGGTVKGVVVNTWDGTPLPSVVVTVRGTTLSAQTDANGLYELPNVPPGDQVLRFSKSGFTPVVVTDVRVLLSQSTTVNGNLHPNFYEIGEYEVKAVEFTESTDNILLQTKGSSSMLSGIGSDFISKTGISDAGGAVGKIAGAAVVEGKAAVVRGLNDRYISTTLNGAEVPSADPYRRSASLDLFPAKVIDQVVVSKTFTPDLPGSYTGGGINIITKSFPEKPFFSLSLGGSYNTRASLNDNFLSYKGGSHDWAAIDDGTRELPSELGGSDLKIPNPPFSSGRPTSSSYNQRVADANELQNLTRAMGVTEFGPTREMAPLNNDFSILGGDTVTLFGRPLGFFAGATYKRDFSFYDDGVARRYAPGSPPGQFEVRKDFAETKATKVVNWSGLFNLGYKPLEDHQVNFNFFYNQNSEDVARQQVGTTLNDPGGVFYLNRLHWTQRNLQTFQLKGNDLFPQWDGINLDWLGAFSHTSQEEPDARFFNYLEEGGVIVVGKASVPEPRNPTRYFRDLEQDNLNGKFDLTIPLPSWTDQDTKFKLGLFGSSDDRTFIDREVYYQGAAPFNGDPNTYLEPGNLGYSATTNRTTGSITYTWNRYIQTRESAYDGTLDVTAGYLMLELPIVSQLRLVGGARYEVTDMAINSRSYLANSITGKSVNDAVLDQTDLLPAASLIYTPITNMNVRLSYSQTIARPTFREKAGYRSYDPVLDDLLDGNPNLVMTSIDNYDARWEWFFGKGELLSVSLYYKDLKNAIERRYITIDGEIISYINRPKAKVYGVEFEARKNLGFIDSLLSDFTLGGNLSLIQSEVDLTEEELIAKEPRVPGTSSTRPLYDQSPYIFNVDLTYDNRDIGTAATVAYNLFGPRISIASLNTEDIYEQPFGTLDFIVSQKFARHLSVKFSAKNLLDPKIERTYGENSNLLYSSYRRGRTFGLSLSYDF
jgi:outer membrane receptor protein involved in Fe transport